MQVKAKAMTRALSILDALGCQYAIITPEGKKVGKLKLADAAPKPKRDLPVKCGAPLGQGFFTGHYVEQGVNKLKPGESVVVPYMPAVGVKRQADNLNSFCYRHLGRDKFMMAKNGAGIEVLRLA